MSGKIKYINETPEQKKKRLSDIKKRCYQKSKLNGKYDANKEKKKIYHANYYLENKEELKSKVDVEARKERDNKRYAENKEDILNKRKEAYDKDPEKIKKRSKKFKEDNPEKVKESQSNYYKKYPWKALAKNEKRRAMKLRLTPKWLTKENFKVIEIFYKNRPKGMEVDHIIPLQGEFVNGFHILENLQYLTPKENREKSNKIDLVEYNKRFDEKYLENLNNKIKETYPEVFKEK